MSGGACLLGIDIGGTFTDVVLARADGGEIEALKEPTTHDDPARGVIRGVEALLDRARVSPKDVARIVHATTLATNLTLENMGAEVALVTTAGFADVARLGRESLYGPQQYDLYFERQCSPISDTMIYEVSERVAANGSILRALDEGELDRLVDEVAAARPASIAVCLLNSYANPVHEKRVANALRDRLEGAYVAASTDVWPDMREYDRMITTAVSALVGPVLDRYLVRLSEQLKSLGFTAPLQVMQSNGGLVLAREAAARAVYAIESGPAAGVVAAAQLGAVCDAPNLIAFDMGGTTAKAALVRDGEVAITREFNVGSSISASSRGGNGFRLQIPVIDLAEVGAGGGSIAWVDSGGGLQVGPRSAGSHPGPACYQLGGLEPTVTDADLVLGYMDPASFAGGGMPISVEAARDAIEALADRLQLPWLDLAVGIHDIANSNMSAAIRRVTVQRGIDPRDYTAFASGGAGPIHIARLAAEFEISRVIVPPLPGVASAIGLLNSDMVLDQVRSHPVRFENADPGVISTILGEVEQAARSDFQRQDAGLEVQCARFAEVRFVHQTVGLIVPLPGEAVDGKALEAAREEFFRYYEREFGIARRDPVEFVSFGVRLTGKVLKPRLVDHAPVPGDGAQARRGSRPAYFSEHRDFVDTPVYERAALRAGDAVEGPAIVRQADATVVVPPGCGMSVDPLLNLIITLPGSETGGEVV